MISALVISFLRLAYFFCATAVLDLFVVPGHLSFPGAMVVGLLLGGAWVFGFFEGMRE